jgi:hypothetical protein
VQSCVWAAKYPVNILNWSAAGALLINLHLYIRIAGFLHATATLT